jgi:thioredoxin reductase (NADPH)
MATDAYEAAAGLPVLLAVDGDADGLAPVESQLRQRYSHDYRVVTAAEPAAALQALTKLADAGDEVALVLAGGSLPSASELFERVRSLHPHAKRTLLVAEGDWIDQPTADAMRHAIALGQADHYVLRPAGSPDEVFHEAVTGFLLEWARDRRVIPQTVHIVGEEWSGRAYELREAFERCAAPHAFWLADSERGRELLATVDDPRAKLPLMILPDGRVLSDPSNEEIAEATGAATFFTDEHYDVVIVGAGPAGLSAAVYGASEGLRVLVVDEAGIGGQATSSSLIRNYLGFASGISGGRLAEEAYRQAFVLGATFVFFHRVLTFEQLDDGFELTLDDGRRATARAIILATGAAYQRIGVPSLEELSGAGVFYGGPVAEAPALTGTHTYIVGGGNSAGQAALHLARYARQVTLVVRAQALDSGMSEYLVQAVEATPNISVLTGTTVVGGGGEGHLRELVLRDAATDAETTVPADALFVLIGARPHTRWLPPEIARDEGGFLLTGDDLLDDHEWPLERAPLALETSIPGVLAAGDVRRGSIKRVASAVGEGAQALQLVHRLFAEDDLHPRLAAGSRVA